MAIKIAVLGSSFMDCKGYLKEPYHQKGRNYGNIQLVHGGVGRNIAENMGTLGYGPYFISTIDNSSFGLDLKEKLGHKGVYTDYLLPINTGGMGMWMAVIEQTGELYSSVTQLPDYSHLEKYIEKYGDKFAKEFDHILIEVDISEKLSKRVISAFKKNKGKIFAYGANSGNNIGDMTIFEEMECLVVNQEVAGNMLKMDISSMEIHHIQKSFKEFVQENKIKRGIITLHQRGSILYDDLLNQSSYIEPVNAEIIDTSGAGEALFAATVAGLLEGLSLKDAVTVGTEYAGIAIGEAANNPANKEKIMEFKEYMKNLLD